MCLQIAINDDKSFNEHFFLNQTMEKMTLFFSLTEGFYIHNLTSEIVSDKS